MIKETRSNRLVETISVRALTSRSSLTLEMTCGNSRGRCGLAVELGGTGHDLSVSGDRRSVITK